MSSSDSTALFVALEGLSGTGKTTTAPLLAKALNAEFLDTLVDDFEPIRRKLDASENVMARMHFWMMANYIISDIIREKLAMGRSVVIESYFYRTLATHGAMGARILPEVDWDIAVRPDLTVLLIIDENERRRRLQTRDGCQYRNRWHRLGAETVDATQELYSRYNLAPLDVTGLPPGKIVEEIVQIAKVMKRNPADLMTSSCHRLE
ncbi:AAA family ATPase [Gandjariella thermophila]|uniref:Thymidylate kinase-like domain-containing protein n=1 Tax=Gandjariella thermophila TaxID=1931992 RepID=A0A4D4JAP9_9PSEU|nr:AAA family ATPase [Gandjariella thermophila]GDY33895.1 hypothetical protein GTS_55280 [Gandjariella thermophila]